MPHGQKHDQGLQAQREPQDMADEQIRVANEVGTEEVPTAETPSPHESAQKACSSSTTKSSEVSKVLKEQDPRTSQARPHSHFLFHILMQKVAEVVKFLGVKYTTKEPITKAEIMKKVIKEHKYYFPMIFKNVCDYMEVVFGIEVKEVDATNHAYELVKIIDLTYDGRFSDDQGIPKTGLLMLILGVIFMEGNRAPEEKIWEVLRKIDIYSDKHDFMCTNPKKFIFEELVQEQYLECNLVPESDPPCFELLWGPRAHAEASKMKVLKFFSKITGSNPTEYVALYREALRDEEERAHQAAAAMADPAAKGSDGSSAKPRTK
uniref:MAGE family member A13 n=1 Tax=Jaculus jaculus TaxID=51337 RepID=A0A8C5KB05_JACJA